MVIDIEQLLSNNYYYFFVGAHDLLRCCFNLIFYPFFRLKSCNQSFFPVLPKVSAINYYHKYYDFSYVFFKKLFPHFLGSMTAIFFLTTIWLVGPVLFPFMIFV